MVLATGLKDGTLTISKVPLFIFNSAPQNLSHFHKNLKIAASTSYLSIQNILGRGLSGQVRCYKRQDTAHVNMSSYVGPIPVK